MNVAKKIAIAATAIFMLNAAAPQAAERAGQLAMKPLQGISFDVGTKRAVSYFLRENGACNLVLTLGEAPNWNEVASLTVTRFEAAVPANKETRFHSAEGKILKFTCHAGAKSMSIEGAAQVAISAIR